MSESREILPDTYVDFDAMSEEETMAFIDAFLNRLSYGGLGALIGKAQAKQQAKQEDERKALIAEFESRAASLGLRVRLEPLAAETQAIRKGRVDGRRVVPAKYRGPNGETWSGRGRPPGWLSVLEAGGHNREEFRLPREGS